MNGRTGRPIAVLHGWKWTQEITTPANPLSAATKVVRPPDRNPDRGVQLHLKLCVRDSPPVNIELMRLEGVMAALRPRIPAGSDDSWVNGTWG